jgi:hypothetical protein
MQGFRKYDIHCRLKNLKNNNYFMDYPTFYVLLLGKSDGVF